MTSYPDPHAILGRPVDPPALRLFTCTDHKGHWPVGVASIVLAHDETHARVLLDAALAHRGLGDGAFTLNEIVTNVAQAIVLNDGEY